MNDIVNRFLLAGYKLMLETYSTQSGFTYSACNRFIWIKKELKELCNQ